VSAASAIIAVSFSPNFLFFVVFLCLRRKLKNLNQPCMLNIQCCGSLILRLRRRHLELLKQETERMHPVEACAMLFGELSKNEAAVEKVEVAENRLRSTTRFEVDPAKVAAAITEAEKEGYEFIGLFHSHPAPAAPSSVDLKYMRLWGDALWLILSSTDGKLAAYQLIEGTVKEATIRIK
jgi:proteasome lid subunit RPN8/RPN11